MSSRYWATVAKDNGYIRDVGRASNRENAEQILTASYTPEFKALFDIKPVKIVVDEEVDASEK